MISNLLKKIFGSRNDRLLKQYGVIVKQINALEPSIKALSDAELRGRTDVLRQKVQDGASLDDVLPEAFAVCREGSVRSLGMRHFDVQLIGGIALHQGKIAEMRTGEGKTLVATLPCYLNALAGKGVHVVTVNEYLAQRDANTMARLFNFLGMTCGVNVSELSAEEKQAAYQCDITYGTNGEFGFDYLRDNMVYAPEQRVQRKLSFAIVDEVDSILIDEARTPLIISGPADDNTDLYVKINAVPPKLVRQETEEGEGDYWVDEKAHSVILSEAGHEHVEQILTEMGLLEADESLYATSNLVLVHHINAALRAHTLYQRDQQYVVMDGEIIIVDEFTGRLMSGRRWSDGLHQAVEAKEGLEINQENQTLATVTLQNYFRMYDKLGGMTGTADTEAYEFQQIYSLETVIIPTNKPMIRADHNDLIYKTADAKHRAIIADIKDCYTRGQPVLVGTASIEQSELLADLLTREKLPHNVLNAKQHAREAEIIIQAGAPGVITIATNMAGRGTDIVLGGNPEPGIRAVEQDESLDPVTRQSKVDALKAEWQKLHEQVVAAGGLHIIGSERHESRRIDNQLRGRSGRQGDPGSSRFYLSLEDPLMRIFASDMLTYVMNKLKIPDDEPIHAPMVNRAIETAQRKVEGRNFDIRKQLLEYDDVANEQRRAIYTQRNALLDAHDVGDTVVAMRDGVASDLVDIYIPPEAMAEQWNKDGLSKAARDYGLDIDVAEWVASHPTITEAEIKSRVQELFKTIYEAKIAEVGEAFHNFEQAIFLQHLDQQWREHLYLLDHLRQGIHLRSYGQKNPKQEYKREAFELFASLLDRVREGVVRVVMNVVVRSEEEVAAVPRPALDESKLEYHHNDATAAMATGDEGAINQALQSEEDDKIRQQAEYAGVGRNEPCPCGSGKKFKQCHGKLV